MAVLTNLNLADEEDLDVWDEDDVSTSVTYTYCDGFTISDGEITATSTSTVSLAYAGDFTVLKTHFLQQGYEWFYIPEDAEINKAESDTTHVVTITKAQHARCGRSWWGDSKTKVIRNAGVMTETTLTGGVYWDIAEDGSHTFVYGYELKNQNGVASPIKEYTETVYYDNALEKFNFEFLLEGYVENNGLYYWLPDPDSATITCVQGSGFRRVTISPATKVEISEFPAYTTSLETKATRTETTVLVSYADAGTDTELTFYNSCGIDDDAVNVAVSDPVELTVHCPTDDEWTEHGSDYYAEQFRSKYLPNGYLITADAEFTRTAETVPVTYKLTENEKYLTDYYHEDYFVYYIMFDDPNDFSTYIVGDHWTEDGGLKWSPFVNDGVVTYYDSLSIDTETGEITGVGEHTATVNYSNFYGTSRVFLGKYSYLTPEYDGFTVAGSGGVAYPTYEGWFKWDAFYVEWFQWGSKYRFHVDIATETAVWDETKQQYHLGVTTECQRITRTISSDVCLRSIGATQYFDTCLSDDIKTDELTSIPEPRTQLIWEHNAGTVLATSKAIFGHVWDYAIAYVGNIMYGYAWRGFLGTSNLAIGDDTAEGDIVTVDMDAEAYSVLWNDTENTMTDAMHGIEITDSPYIINMSGRTGEDAVLDTVEDLNLYACRIIGTDSTTGKRRLFRDYIPAIKKSTWDSGLYDIATDTFYNMSGTGFLHYLGKKLWIWDDETTDAKEKGGASDATGGLKPLGGGVDPDTLTAPWIQSTGEQWIDTGLVCDRSTRIELQYMEAGTLDSKAAWVIGARDNDNSKSQSARITLESSPSGLIFSAYTNQYSAYRNIDGLVNTITLSGSGSCKFNKTRIKFSSPGKFTTRKTLFLCGCNNNGFAQGLNAMRLYYLKIWKSGTLVRDFVPCISGSEVGLYDNVESEFYRNLGRGAFTYGGSNIMTL